MERQTNEKVKKSWNNFLEFFEACEKEAERRFQEIMNQRGDSNGTNVTTPILR